MDKKTKKVRDIAIGMGVMKKTGSKQETRNMRSASGRKFDSYMKHNGRARTTIKLYE